MVMNFKNNESIKYKEYLHYQNLNNFFLREEEV